MKFHAVLLYIDDQFPDISIFRKLQEVGRGLYPKGAYLYSVEQKLIADRFYWMYFQYDNAKLYSDKVIDTEDNSVKENPRPKSQVEPRLQLFSCYDLERHILYVSDYSKKATITDYISEMLQKSAQTKNVLRSVDDFLNVVTQLKSVCFTQRRTLFTSKEDSIFKKQANLYGLDLPEKSKIRLDYGATPIGAAKNALRDWKMKRESGEFEDVIVVGMDDNKIQMLQKTVSFDIPLLIKPVIEIKNPDSTIVSSLQAGAYKKTTKKMIDIGIPRELAIRLNSMLQESRNSEKMDNYDYEQWVRKSVLKIKPTLSYWEQAQLEFLGD